jgi:hypothetical protein
MVILINKDNGDIIGDSNSSEDYAGSVQSNFSDINDLPKLLVL